RAAAADVSVPRHAAAGRTVRRVRMKKTLLAAVLAAGVLVACGGGDDNGPPPATAQVPASASQSADGFIGYLRDLVASMADLLEPVDTSAVTPPSDDAAEPQKVD